MAEENDFKSNIESVLSVVNIKQETQTDVTPPTTHSSSHLDLATNDDFKPNIESVVSMANIKQEAQTCSLISEPKTNVRILTEDRYSFLLSRMHQLKELFVRQKDWSQSYALQRDLFNEIMTGFSNVCSMPSSNLVQPLETIGYDVSRYSLALPVYKIAMAIQIIEKKMTGHW